jgi:hypothetical protein
MTPLERDRMNSLCIEVQEEKNYHRFEALLQELSALVRQKELRFPEYDRASNRYPRWNDRPHHLAGNLYVGVH